MCVRVYHRAWVDRDLCCVVVHSGFLCGMCLDRDTTSRFRRTLHYASFLEAAPPVRTPPPQPPSTHTQACRQEGSREPLGFQTRQEEGKGLASPSPASTLRGPNRGGEEGDASPTHFLSSRPSPPPASSPAASRAPPARRRGPRCVLWRSGRHSSVSSRAGAVQRSGGHRGTWASRTLLS